MILCGIIEKFGVLLSIVKKKKTTKQKHVFT